MTAMACAIWKMPAQLLEGAGEFQVFDSPRAGGKYWISGAAVGEILPFNDHARRLLTTWICEQRRAGVEIPKVQSYVLELIKSRQTLPVMARMTLALQYLGLHITQLGDSLNVGRGGAATDTLQLLAETESKNIQELLQLLQMLEESGFVQGTFHLDGGASVQPTVRGWQDLDSLKRPRTDSPQAFVAMWFNELTSEAYTNGIELAVTATGYKAIASAAHHSMASTIAVRGRGGSNPPPSSTTPASNPPAALAASSRL